jgi:hypothetical protein
LHKKIARTPSWGAYFYFYLFCYLASLILFIWTFKNKRNPIIFRGFQKNSKHYYKYIYFLFYYIFSSTNFGLYTSAVVFSEALEWYDDAGHGIAPYIASGWWSRREVVGFPRNHALLLRFVTRALLEKTTSELTEWSHMEAGERTCARLCAGSCEAVLRAPPGGAPSCGRWKLGWSEVWARQW